MTKWVRADKRAGNPILDEIRDTCLSDEMLETIQVEKLEKSQIKAEEKFCSEIASLVNQVLPCIPIEDIFCCLVWSGYDLLIRIAGETPELAEIGRTSISDFYNVFLKEIEKIKGKKNFKVPPIASLKEDIFPSTGKPAIVIQRSITDDT